MSGAPETGTSATAARDLLGLALMRVRDELIADVRTRLAALAPDR